MTGPSVGFCMSRVISVGQALTDFRVVTGDMIAMSVPLAA